MDRQKAFEIWEVTYGGNVIAYDFASHPMKKEDYQNESSYYGWDIDEKMPNVFKPDNFIPCSLNTIRFRQKKTSFKVGNHMFEIRRGPVYGSFCIYDITNRNEPINMSPTVENQDSEFNRRRFHEIASNSKEEENIFSSFSVPTVHDINTSVFEQHLEDANLGVETTYDDYAEEDTEEFDDDDEEVAEEEIGDEEELSEESNEEVNEENSYQEILTEGLSENLDNEVLEPVDEPLENPWSKSQEEQGSVEENKDKVQIEELETQLMIQKNLANALSSSLEQIKKERQQIINEKTNVGVLMHDFSLRISQLNKENESIKKNTISKEIYDELLTNYQNEKQTSKDNFNSVLDANNYLKDRINQLTETIEKYKEKESNLLEDKEVVNNELSLVKEINNSLSNQLNNLKTDSNQTIDINQLMADNETIKNENKILLNQIHNLGALKDVFGLRINQLQKEYDSLDNKYLLINHNEQTLKADYDQLDAQSQMVDDQLQQVNYENSDLENNLKQLKLDYEELLKKSQEQEFEISYYKTTLDSLKNNNNNQVSNFDEQLKQKQNQIEALESKLKELQEKENLNQNEKLETILQLKAERDYLSQMNEFLSIGGSKEQYQDVLLWINDNNKEINIESFKEYLSSHHEVKQQEIVYNTISSSLVIDESIEENSNEYQAKQYYCQVFHGEKKEAIDFAGRKIAFDEFDTTSDKSWNYVKIDNDGTNDINNIIVANKFSLEEFKKDAPFKSNGHEFQLVQKEGVYKIESADFIANPYDFENAVNVSQNNKDKITNLVYIFVKCTGVGPEEASVDNIRAFYDIMDKTAKRCCPISFIELKSFVGSSEKNNYALVTFDGSCNEAYTEAMDYALLLNSYRLEFKKKGMFNAVIVINETVVQNYNKHLDLDRLIKDTNDVELRALSYEFNMAVINSIIKRTIHIGPAILDKVNVDRSLLQPSRIGQDNFAQIYNFKKQFMTYNVIFDVNSIK